MILSFDEAGALLDEMAEEFPPEFYDELNGGIALLPEAKEDSEGEPGELYIMGEYCNDMMGKYINLYYGSFAALAEQEDWTEEDWEDELYTTLAHEFTHHIEGRAGERGLERKDEQFIEEFRAGRGEWPPGGRRSKARRTRLRPPGLVLYSAHPCWGTTAKNSSVCVPSLTREWACPSGQ